MMGNELITLDSERLNEMVEAMPTGKRVPFAKAIRAAQQYAHDRANYEKAIELAIAVLENEWHLGKETKKLDKAKRGPDPADTLEFSHKNGKTSKAIALREIGISSQRCSMAEKIAGGFTKKQLVAWAEAMVVEERKDTEKPPTKYPRITGAVQEARRREHHTDDEDGECDPPEGEYGVIVIDPPWPMKKIEREERPNQVELQYQPMQEADLVNLEIPAADDCHMWCWTTHKFLPMALRLLQKWGFRYVCTFVWHKPGGFQPVGLPQYNCEFALYARKGSPTFVHTKAFPVCFNAGRGEHSEKPEEFYDVIRRVCGLNDKVRGADMFNRREIDCFDGWGYEAE